MIGSVNYQPLKLWLWASSEKQGAVCLPASIILLSSHPWWAAVNLSLISWSFPQRERAFRSRTLRVWHAASRLVHGECSINVYFKMMYERFHNYWKQTNLKSKDRVDVGDIWEFFFDDLIFTLLISNENIHSSELRKKGRLLRLPGEWNEEPSPECSLREMQCKLICEEGFACT